MYDFSILVVEDNALNQRVTVSMLNMLGIRSITSVSNGEEALHAVASKRYDLILMDVVMPVMDGLETPRKIRNQEARNRPSVSSADCFSNLLIVALTDCCIPGKREECLLAGMNDFLLRPVSHPRFSEVLWKWLPKMMAHERSLADGSASLISVEKPISPEESSVNAPPLFILLVEDEKCHAEIARRSLIEALVPHRLIHVEDGQAALDYLHRESCFKDVESDVLPDLIFLDLHLPKVDGLEVLRRIQDNKNLRKIPTIVLTTSANSSDKDIAYRLGAAGYHIKPVNSKSLKAIFDARCKNDIC